MKSIEELIENLKKIDIKGSEITVLDILNKSHYDENFISDWLAFIFNPEINGMGNKPICSLINSLDISKSNVQNKDIKIGWSNDIKEFKDTINEQKFIGIEREKVIDDNKRIDVLIKYSNTWIIIENKINSMENGTQTRNYYKYIMKKKKEAEKELTSGKINVIFIYLKPNYNKSEPSDENFIPLTYSQLFMQICKINEHDYNEKEMYKYKYLEELERMMKNYMKEEEFDLNNIAIKTYINYSKEIASIKEQYSNNNKILVQKIVTEIENLFNKDNGYEINKKNNDTLIQIGRTTWKNGNKNGYFNGIHYEVNLIEKNNILGFDNVELSIALHIEENINNIELEKLNKETNIGKIPKDRLNAYDYEKDKLIEYTEKYNFTNEKFINQSIEKIINRLESIDKEYCKKIDSVFGELLLEE